MGLVLKPRIGLRPRWHNNPMAIRAPIGAWVFNQGSGNKVFDLSGNGNDFTLYNHTWNGIGVRFNGTDAYGSANSLISRFGSSSAFSMVMGYKPLTIPASDIFVCGEVSISAYTLDYGFYQRSAGNAGEMHHYAESNVVDSNVAMVAIQNYNLAAINKAVGTEHRIYIDGIYKNVGTTATITTGGFNLILARWNARYLHCEIEYVYIYDYVLPAAQIAYLHQYPYYAWEQPELWELYAGVAAGETIELDALTATGSVPNTSLALGAVQLGMDALTASISAENITLSLGEVQLVLDAISASGSAPSLTLSLGEVQIILNALAATGSAEGITLSMGQVQILLDALVAAAQAQNLSVSLALLIALNALSASATAQSMTLSPGEATIILDALEAIASAPDIRLATVATAALERLISVLAENRIITVASENRIVTVPAEDRTKTI